MPQFSDSLMFTGKSVTTSTTAQVLFGPDATAPLISLPSNAKTITFTNLDPVNDVYIQVFSSQPGAVPTLTILDSVVVQANTTLPLDVGPAGQRGDVYATGQTVYIQAASGTPLVNVVLLMCAGSLYA